MRRTSPLFINLTDKTIEFAVPGGGAGSALSVQVDLPDEANAWIGSVPELAPVIMEAAQSLGIEHACVSLAYDSPSLTTQLVSQAAGSEGQAATAARLASASGAHYGTSPSVTDACVIGIDAADHTGTNENAPNKYHVVAATDRQAACEALVSLIERCGWTLQQLISLDSFVVSREARTSLAHHSPAPLARLYLGRRHSVLSVGCAGRLRLFRRIGFGIDLLAEALCKPIPLGHDGQREAQLEWAQALDLLYTQGLPSRDTEVCQGTEVKGYHVLPLIQPVLQRLLVELKQSLRFGLNEFEPSDIQGVLTGPGAYVDGVAGLLSESTGIDFQASPSEDESREPENPAWNAYSFGQFVSDADDTETPNLLPPSAISRVTARRIRYGLAAGCAAAVILIGADTFRLNHAIASARVQLEQAVQSNENLTAMDDLRQQVIENNGRLQALNNQMAETYLFRVDWAAGIKELTRLAPPEIKLIQIDAGADDAEKAEAGYMTVHAYSLGPSDDEVIQQYITRLSDSALFASVRIGPVQKVNLDGTSARRFSVETRLSAVDRGETAPATDSDQ
ncbi:MAG: hypothetical protein D8M59_01100 [Planctomycetes bacterium]|nr:hypothetical protein [Planctomycetota bacterium]NOG54681.1 hypothetical protein [Planctomycetota bacterium]